MVVVFAAEKRRLEVDSRTPAAAGKEGTAVGRVNERAGVSKRGEEGRAKLRLCNLVAQRNAEGRLQAGDGEGENRAGSETWQIIYFKPYETQMPVVEQAIELAALMPGSDKSRG